MIRSRLIRKLAAATAVLGILFAQFMVAAYACPELAKAVEAHADPAPLPCHQGSEPVDGLCQAHCQDGQKNVASAVNAVAADFVPAFMVRLSEPQPSTQIATAACVDETAPPHAPPILLRNCCFRI